MRPLGRPVPTSLAIIEAIFDISVAMGTERENQIDRHLLGVDLNVLVREEIYARSKELQ